MGIWIKTQFRNELILCTDIYVGAEKKGKEPIFNQKEVMLGEYDGDSDEAWDVINLIQNSIENNKRIFVMPEDGFSLGDEDEN